MNLRSLESTIVCLILFALTLCYSTPAFAIVNLSLLASPDGKSWSVQARGLENINGITLDITYDATVLSNARVSPGSLVAGTTFMANPNAASEIEKTNKVGRIKIASATTKNINGTGPIATISFNRVKSGEANVAIANQEFINDQINKVPSTVNTQGTSESKGDDSNRQIDGSDPQVNNQGGQTGNQTPSTGSGVVVTGGTITMPSETTTPAEEGKSDPTPEYKEEAQREAPAVARDTNGEPESKQQESAKHQETRIKPAKSILTRFKEYKGEMTSKALIDLFAVNEKAAVRQDPPIMIADGKSTLKIIIPGSEGKDAPNFALKKAKLANLKMSGDNNWIVETKPEKGATDVTVTMLLGDTAVEIPVNCAPKADVDLDKTGKIDENDFRLFLKDRGTIKAPKYDVNNDGSRNYIDDYIFTANFIASQPKVKEKAGAKATEKTKDVKQPKDTAEKKVKAKTK